ncbi:hypothetical protein NM688_g3152 [Phlebia brevispora]|uniref:Uncharacterized protein n=1 Tax=Phlebia brevispora TaxID=194682 RepID=A0ACC1T6M0_9APHY|nr:hypothetical protein NM688_g3152 [Phlebia brevispora]
MSRGKDLLHEACLSPALPHNPRTELFEDYAAEVWPRSCQWGEGVVLKKTDEQTHALRSRRLIYRKLPACPTGCNLARPGDQIEGAKEAAVRADNENTPSLARIVSSRLVLLQIAFACVKACLKHLIVLGAFNKDSKQQEKSKDKGQDQMFLIFESKSTDPGRKSRGCARLKSPYSSLRSIGYDG